MAVIYIAFLEIPVARDFYQMSPLEPATIAVLLALGIMLDLRGPPHPTDDVVLAAETCSSISCSGCGRAAVGRVKGSALAGVARRHHSRFVMSLTRFNGFVM